MLEDFCFHPLGQAKHVDGAVNAGLGCLHRVALIMDGRCRTSEIVNLVDLGEERKRDVSWRINSKPLVIKQMLDVAAGSAETNYRGK
jgi:hypothetical protein